MDYQQNERQINSGDASEQGFSMVEVLVAVVLSSIVSIGLTQSTITSFRLSERMVNDSVAAQVALEAIEEFASVDPQTLDDSDDAVDNSIVREGVSLTRAVDVTINADRTRSVAVTVTTNRAQVQSSVSLEGVFALWGER